MWSTITRREQLLLAMRPLRQAGSGAIAVIGEEAGANPGRKENCRCVRRIRALYRRGCDAGSGALADDRLHGRRRLPRLYRGLDCDAERRAANVSGYGVGTPWSELRGGQNKIPIPLSFPTVEHLHKLWGGLPGPW